MMDPGYGALDPTNPRDRAWAAAWRVNEELKQAWAKTGYAPERAPSLKWHQDHGAELRTTTGRIIRIRVKRNRSDRLPCPRQPAQLRPRQLKARRIRRASRAASDGDRGEDADPHSERRTPSVDEADGVMRLVHDGPGTTKTRARISFVTHFPALHNAVALPVRAPIR
jgi:hypothetical protein